MSYRSFGISLALFILATTTIWTILFSLQVHLPYVSNGAAVVGHFKRSIAAKQSDYDNSNIRIAAFGDSRTLAAFNPRVFDALFAPKVRSYNFGIPGDSQFMPVLKTLLTSGTHPTHILLQYLPMDPVVEDSWRKILKDDKLIVNTLFPFRNFVRDLFLFVSESRSDGGLLAHYRSNRDQIEKLEKDRGYYFIKSQSHYAGNRLPDGYSLPTDRPTQVLERYLNTSNNGFVELTSLANKYELQIFVVPTAVRPGELAVPPEEDKSLSDRLKSFPQIHVVGPAYWIFELKYFSDPVHLNPDGAAVYSKRLADLLKPEFGN